MHATKRMTIKQMDADAGSVTAIIATLDVVDSDDDITLPGAFGEQTAQVVPAHDWSHVWIGKALVHEVGRDVIAEIKLNLDIPAARDWHSALKFDLAHGRALGEWSYGYTPTKYRHGEHEGRKVRYLEAVRVHEVSPVMLGAGVGTRTLSAKDAPLLCAACQQPLSGTTAGADDPAKLARQLFTRFLAGRVV